VTHRRGCFLIESGTDNVYRAFIETYIDNVQGAFIESCMDNVPDAFSGRSKIAAP
jgi:hypothetical protein